MTNSIFTRHSWLLNVAWWLLLSGCAGSPSGPPPINRQQLVGVWRQSQDNFHMIWTFQQDGSLRFQASPENTWLRFFGGDIDVPCRWTLDGDRLTIEYLEAPPLALLAGVDWSGQQHTLRIKRLTANELEFYDSDLRFRRSLAPVEAK